MKLSDGCLWFVGPYAVLVCRVLDFAFHHTDHNTSLGSSLQDVSSHFLCSLLESFQVQVLTN